MGTVVCVWMHLLYLVECHATSCKLCVNACSCWVGFNLEYALVCYLKHVGFDERWVSVAMLLGSVLHSVGDLVAPGKTMPTWPHGHCARCSSPT